MDEGSTDILQNTLLSFYFLTIHMSACEKYLNPLNKNKFSIIQHRWTIDITFLRRIDSTPVKYTCTKTDYNNKYHKYDSLQLPGKWQRLLQCIP